MTAAVGAPIDERRWEEYELSEPTDTADSFLYRIILDKTAGSYWIMRSGGVSGVPAVFGPGRAH
jgi:hypothetical protein